MFHFVRRRTRSKLMASMRLAEVVFRRPGARFGQDRHDVRRAGKRIADMTSSSQEFAAVAAAQKSSAGHFQRLRHGTADRFPRPRRTY